MSGVNRQGTGPLAGVRLLDLTSVVAGPYMTEQLGDLGADVIKIESPEGDISRDIGPRRNPGMSAQFLNFNRNKRSVVLDLKQPAGIEALKRIVPTCAAFVANMRPLALERLGITYAEISKVNPSIVYLRIVGFGEEGMDRDRPALDDIIQAASGLVSLQEELTGAPSYIGMALADMTVGLMASAALTAALYRRAVTGDGEEVEVRMYDSMAAFVLQTHLSGSIFEPPLGPPIYPRSVARGRRPLKTADGAISVAPYTDRQWSGFYRAVGRPDIEEDSRFQGTYQRSNHLQELYQIVGELLSDEPTSHWLDEFAREDVPCYRVNTTADLLADPGLEAAGLFLQAEHPSEGPLKLLNNPLRFSQNPLRLREFPPLLGADTESVLMEVGYSIEELAALRRAGVTEPAVNPHS